MTKKEKIEKGLYLKPHRNAKLGEFRTEIHIHLLSPPIYNPDLDKTYYYKVVERCIWLSPCGRQCVCEAEYLSDGTSMPWVGRIFLRKEGKHSGATVCVHDPGYDGALKITPKLPLDIDERQWLDYQMWNASTVLNVSPVKAYTMWAGVRVGGCVPWAKGRKSRIDKKKRDKAIQQGHS